jgi:Uma2 family endonuclease
MDENLARHGMLPGEFLGWLVQQEHKYELVDGQPVMMAGATRRHRRISLSMTTFFDSQLQGKKCQAFNSDTMVKIPSANGNYRFPDLGVECGDFRDEKSLEASEPVLVVDVFSETTEGTDRTRKVEEYKTVNSIQYILLVDPNIPEVLFYSRGDDKNWNFEVKIGLDAVVDMPQIGVTLPLRVIYQGLEFYPRPTLAYPQR